MSYATVLAIEGEACGGKLAQDGSSKSAQAPLEMLTPQDLSAASCLAELAGSVSGAAVTHERGNGKDERRHAISKLAGSCGSKTHIDLVRQVAPLARSRICPLFPRFSTFPCVDVVALLARSRTRRCLHSTRVPFTCGHVCPYLSTCPHPCACRPHM